MKSLSTISIGIVLSFLIFSCSPTNPNRARALQLLAEINQIAESSKANLISQDIRNKAIKIGENRKKFPDSRGELKKDAKSVNDFTLATIEEDNQIIQKYEELLKLGLVKPEADCVQNVINSENANIDKKRTIMSELNLFFDEDIKDLATLEAKTLAIRSKTEEIDNKIDELKRWKDVNCRSSHDESSNLP